MNFIDLQSTVYNAIKASTTFAPDAASTVCMDVGNKKPFIEAALDITTTPPGKGYAVSVWPVARGHSDGELAGDTGVNSTVVVRFEVNPNFLATMSDDDAVAWVNTRVSDIVSAVLSIDPEAGGVKFGLSADALELVNFDEGLLAYHIRFVRLAIFGV